MAPPAHLDVRDVTGDRRVPIDASPFTIGRRETNHLRLGGTEVSRDHADITGDGSRYCLRDRGSRYGTFVNDQPVTEHVLAPGDRIRLGRGGGADLMFGHAQPRDAVTVHAVQRHPANGRTARGSSRHWPGADAA